MIKKQLFDVGRIFYGFVIAGLGLQTIYKHDFPYMLIPYKHSWIPGLAVVAYVFGGVLLLTGLCILFKKKIQLASLLLGTMLLAVFCFYFIPYQFITSTYAQLVQWENAEKELALACGALVIAGCYSEKDETPFTKVLAKLIPLGSILFSITMISFGIIHFQYADGVADYVPAWVPARLFWAYFAGAALIGSGLTIIFKFKVGLFASLLGLMIFGWVVLLHIPRVVVSPALYLNSEITSTLIALGYSGIAFVIGGKGKGSDE